ncbi:protein CASC1-like, partial [Contarinia nasturtii]|uniref:protein CASC1-like n=1 Tax=Contarinia nasturtii TaxID=265458 RepID=UPI0012D46E55
LKTQRSIKTTSRHFKSTEVNIIDFNLLRIPPKIDINFIVQDIIVPRLPDGYTIALSEPKSRPASSVLFSDDATSVKRDRIQIQSTKDFLIPTNSPRFLHPKRTLKFSVKILERKPIDVNADENEYLFSQLLQDLDDMYDKQQPQITKQMEEISDILSMSISDEQGSDQQDVESNTDDMLFKPEEFTWNLNKKVEVVPEVIEPVEEESEHEFEESDDDESPIQKKDENIIGRWSTRDVHDPKFNEEKLAVQFRAGRLGCFGLAVNWYANLPFQTWECKPDLKKPGHIFYSLTASVVSIDITITETGLILNSFQGGTAPPIQDAIGSTMSFQELKELLYKSGINLFPDKDAFCYCETICEKDVIMEFHLYDCMAHLGLTHNFMWSRWNSQLNSRSIALLIREIIEKRKTPTYSTLFVTP